MSTADDPLGPNELCARCAGEVSRGATHCPSCGHEVRSAFEAAVNEGVLVPSPFEPQWPISRWHDGGSGQAAPQCRECGEAVRADDRDRRGYFGYANPPWNAGWDGTCERCGHRYELRSEHPLHLHVKRTLTVRPDEKFYRTFIDEGIVLSGIRLSVVDNQYGEEPQTHELFVSMGELAQLAQALQDKLAIYWEQYDWSEDWT